MEFINTLTADAIKVNGRMESSMVKELLSALKAYLERVNGNKENVFIGSMK